MLRASDLWEEFVKKSTYENLPVTMCAYISPDSRR